MSFDLNRCVIGDCRETLREVPDQVFACCITSPPYWGLRDYGHPGQLGLESTPGEYVDRMVEVFREVRRVLRNDGTLWLNIGDSYATTAKGGGGVKSFQTSNMGSLHGNPKRFDLIAAGLKQKDLVGIPWRLAFALQTDGWYLRSDIIWAKPNPMPESVTDRPTKAHEYVFLMAKRERYFYDASAIAEKGCDRERFGGVGKKPNPNRQDNDRHDSTINQVRNIRTIWEIVPLPFAGAHFATMPPALVTRCVLAGSPLGGAVLDPFFGTGTVGEVSESLGRKWFGCELNPDYGKLVADRTAQTGLPFGEVKP